MANKDEMKGKGEELLGKAKKGVGDLTGDENMRAEGEAQELKGKARQSAGHVKEGVKGAADSIRQAGRDMKS